MSKKSRRKGSSGEREAANYLGGKRTWAHEHDVYAQGRYWEVKRLATGFTPAYNALEEYERHNEESGETGAPVVIARQDRKPWIVIQYADDWLREHDENNSQRTCQEQCCRGKD